MNDDLIAGSEVEFPEMVQGVLDDATLQQYFDDLGLTEVFDVLVKGAPEEYAKEGTFTLERGRELFDAGVVRGLQIRYQYQDEEWWDTLMRSPAGVRLIRVRHDWSEFE